MLFCVDIGNTQIALGVYDGGGGGQPQTTVVRDWRMRTDPRMTSDELEVAFDGMLGCKVRVPRVAGVAAPVDGAHPAARAAE